jgi:GxxExxY protein
MTAYESASPEINVLTGEIIDAAMTVHRSLGPGLLETVYEQCLHHELVTRGQTVLRQVPVPVTYDTVTLDTGFRIDLLVNDVVIVELKAVEAMIPLYDAQLLTYLKLTQKHAGLLINFNVPRLKTGIKRLIRTPSL